MSGATGRFLYFAYGSNLSSARIRLQNPSAVFVSVAMLNDFRLDFDYYSQRWKGAAATIQPASGHRVFGVLWELELQHLATLDQQEGVDHQVYRRLEVPVHRCHGPAGLQPEAEKPSEEVMAWTYQLLPHRCTSQGQLKKPSQIYKKVILSGAREHKLPEEYIVEVLQAIEDNGYDGQVEVALPLHLQPS